MSTLNEYLKGNEARFSKLAAIAKACSVSLNWLAWGEGYEAPVPELIMLQPNVLDAPAHFWGLFVLIRSCQEYNEQMGLTPTFAEVLDWIGPAYLKARELSDRRIEFKGPEETA